MWLAEEGSTLKGVMTELMAQDAEGAFGVAEAASDFGGRLLIDEVSAEGFRTGAARGTAGRGRSCGWLV